MRSKFKTIRILLAIFLSLTYLGCGGGGGGDGGGGGGESSGITYSGLTSQANIDENNATDLASSAFAAGQTGSVSSVFATLKEKGEQKDLQIDNFRTYKIPAIFGKCIRSIDLAPPLYKLSSTRNADYTDTGKEHGPCGGTFSYTITVNAKTGVFSGNFTFSKYCDQGITLSGRCRVNGKLDPDTGDIIRASFSFENMRDETMIIDATISLNFSISPTVCSIDGYFTDKETGLVYWIRNYSVYIGEYAGYEEVEIVGRFYHPDHGYVVVSTPEPFIIYEGDGWPSSGILMVEGTQLTTAMLSAIDNQVCRVEADTDGDGHNDCDSGILIWTDYEPFDEIVITGSRLEFRTYSDSTQNRYKGWIEFLNDDLPIRESDITNVVLRDQDQNEIEIVRRDFDPGEYYSGWWNSDNQQVDFGGPYIYTGFSIDFSESATIASGYYTYEATTRNGNNLSETQYFPGKLELMVINSESMNSEWTNGDLKLSWTNPDPGGSDSIVVYLFSEENGFELYLGIYSLPNTASEVTIPEEWVNNVKQLSGANAIRWLVQLRVRDDTTNNNYARSQSDSKTIDGWND